MQTLSIDIETYSSTDLIKCGVYKYVEAPDFTILLFAYSFDKNPVQIVDLAGGEQLPQNIIDALQSVCVVKKAYNANFERVCLSKYLLLKLPVYQWECTMMKSSMLGLPLSLDAAAKALKLEDGKDSAGKALIRYFSIPCKPTKANNGRIRNLPEHDQEKWNRFKEYCIQDVVVEKTIGDRIAFFNIPENEKKLWRLDQKINDTGLLIDAEFVKKAIYHDALYKKSCTEEAIKLTGLDNPNSVAQLKTWIESETGNAVTKLNKESVPLLLKEVSCDIVKRVLGLRQEMSKTSVKKYEAMRVALCNDGRIRGLLQFYGANRTGRWAGRLVQVHNLPQNHFSDLDLAKELFKKDDIELLEMFFLNVPDTLSQLIRAAFIAPAGHRFLVADFSAIEARVIAWLAGETWRLEVFKTHGKIYEASAAQMFRVPISSITKGSDLRQRGKVSELALGYGGGPDALITMGALKMGLTEDELPKLVKMWRNANKAIVAYWKTIENAAITTIQTGTPQVVKHGIRFHIKKEILFIDLPSGRSLAYVRPNLTENRFGGMSMSYEGMNQTTKQWGVQETYGGKLVENIVQAVARDLLADVMLRVDAAGYNIVLHVHDELAVEEVNGKGSLEEIINIMRTPIPWANGLPLNAAGFETTYYKKD
jgi:DNA polymerase